VTPAGTYTAIARKCFVKCTGDVPHSQEPHWSVEGSERSTSGAIAAQAGNLSALRPRRFDYQQASPARLTSLPKGRDAIARSAGRGRARNGRRPRKKLRPPTKLGRGFQVEPDFDDTAR